MGAKPRYSAAMLRAWHNRQAQYWELICTGKFSRALSPKDNCPLCIVAKREAAKAFAHDRKKGSCVDCVLLVDAGIDSDLFCWTRREFFRMTVVEVLAGTEPFTNLIVAACERLEMLQKLAHHNGAPILTLDRWWKEKFGKTPRQSANAILEKQSECKTAIQRSDAAGVA